ncbi:hypothetical protein LVD15_03280 [Fulvivirga maritima]|uniref:hypothetical protein n=1 Tax=Fulvivirga maritima TaxID=2904247 RepID=UPI001F26CF26|nr:hypothetical protein [Fulvivirga maritima]UII27468.1 hypothetical protein LVD15_03280 [Fulvivirga maritima]
MSWSIVILPLLGGFYFLSRSMFWRNRIRRMPRQVLIYASGVSGAAWAFATLLTSKLLQLWDPFHLIRLTENTIKDFIQINEPYVYTLACSFFLPVIATELSNLVFKKKRRLSGISGH